jgi:hypothetical protein
MYLKGVKKYACVETYSDHKKKMIKGFILGFSGDSVTKNKFGFDINIKWIEPLQGNDSRFFSSGWYSEKQLKDQKIYLI